MNTILKPCSACGEGNLHPKTEADFYTYKGTEHSVALYFSECDVCGSELSDAQDVLRGKRQVMAIRKQADGLLTGDEVLAIRQRLGLTQAQAAQVFGGGAVAFSKYENNDVAQSEAMNKLIRLAAEVPAARDWLFVEAGLASSLNDYLDVLSLHFKSVSRAVADNFVQIKQNTPKESVEWSMYGLTLSESPHSSSLTFSTVPANDQAYQEVVCG